MNLYSLTAECTVRIEVGGGHGTGFFVGRGLILTCAHVIAAAEIDALQVVWPARKVTCSVENVVLLPSVAITEVYSQYPYPDLALLTISVRDNPSVLLIEQRPEPGDQLYSFGYTDDYRNGDSGYFTVEGPTGGREVLLKLKGGQVHRGMSGAPLLHSRHGGICAVLKSSRGVDTDLGGRAVPSDVVLGHIPRLHAAQSETHSENALWWQLQSATMVSPLHRSGTKWSSISESQEKDSKLVLPSLEIVRFVVNPVSSWEGPANSQYIESVRSLVGPIVELDNLFGGQDLARVASRVFRTVNERIATGDYDIAVETDLLSASAEIAEVAGWLAYDADEQRMSRQLNQEALLLSRLAGDRAIELLVLQNMSMQAGYLGRPREALLLAKTAFNGRPLSSRLSAIFRVREGRALAQEGRDRDARNAFAHARALFSDGSAERDPDWSWWFEQHEMTWHEAMAETDLGNWKQAVEMFRHAIEPTAATSHRDRYVYRSHLLWALTEVGDWRAADEVIGELSGFVGHVASQRTVSLLKRVENRLNEKRGTVTQRRVAEHLGDLLSLS